MGPTDEMTAIAERCTSLALAGVVREYPNKIAHVMHRDEDARAPRELTPIFFGCFDWHSAVHTHWLLARVCRCFPQVGRVAEARRYLADALTVSKVAGEVEYLSAPGRAGFERPYGLAWLLQLCAELRDWDDAGANLWSRTLEPLEGIAAERFLAWLPRLSHPVRAGEHSQTAFAMALVLDWAGVRGHRQLRDLVTQRARDFYLADANWSLTFEPGGQDFLSPALSEADLMRRVLGPDDFASWLGRFLPELDGKRVLERLRPVEVTDPTDGKLAHLDGLNLSRAWMLEGICSALPEDDQRLPRLRDCAVQHRNAGLAALDGEHYEGTHWLATFGIYLVTRKRLRD